MTRVRESKIASAERKTLLDRQRKGFDVIVIRQRKFMRMPTTMMAVAASGTPLISAPEMKASFIHGRALE